MTTIQECESTIKDLVVHGKGILAADESTSTIAKRLATIHVESTEENRRAYREVLLTTPKLSEFISGVILYEETLYQKTKDGKLVSDILKKQGIVPGIKVDKGLFPLANTPDEKITEGLDGLGERLVKYKQAGARFAKWRAVYSISANTPSCLAVSANAEALADYAAVCQSYSIVPIVEPEVLLDGNHTIERCFEVTMWVLREVFHALHTHKVVLEHMILKPSMVVSGKDCPQKASVHDVAKQTIEALRRTVPAAVPSINFLSGGQIPEEATVHLQAMNALGQQPWQVSFSYGRALQDPALKAWAGKEENTAAAQKALYKRAKLNGMAAMGKYSEKMEKEIEGKLF